MLEAFNIRATRILREIEIAMKDDYPYRAVLRLQRIDPNIIIRLEFSSGEISVIETTKPLEWIAKITDSQIKDMLINLLSRART